MSDKFNGLLIGFIVGTLTCSAVAHLPTSKISIIKELVKDCEQSLPRDQHCTIIALPVSKD